MLAFLIITVFGFGKAGASFSGMSLDELMRPVPLGVAAGLFIGKQLGVFSFSWVAIRMNWADLPMEASWRQFYGVALLCGIGFTMSLFIGLLAFDEVLLQDEAKLGVLAGSVLSGLAGYTLLRFSKREAPESRTVPVELA